jgi:hypothetical protein
MTRDFSLRQANPGLKVSVKHRMAQSGATVRGVPIVAWLGVLIVGRRVFVGALLVVIVEV